MQAEHFYDDPEDTYGLIGTVVARRFRVLNLVHIGPRGAVYEIEPPGVGKSRRALKVIAVPEARDPRCMERLQTLVDRLKGIEHQHLETVYELGVLADQMPFVVADWLPLGNLDDALAHGGRLPATRSLQVITGVADGLAELHSRGVAHGDIRPAHVLVAPSRDGFSRVILIDSGMASQLEAPRPRGPTGPAAYLAPECAEDGRATPRADVYSLGVMAWQLLAGEFPFIATDPRADEAGADPMERLVHLHRNVLPKRPGAQLPTVDFSAALENVIGRAMRADPKERFRDANAFIKALDRALADVETEAPEPGLFDEGEGGEAPERVLQPLPTPEPTPATTKQVVPGEASLPGLPEQTAAPDRDLWIWAAAGTVAGALGALLVSLF